MKRNVLAYVATAIVFCLLDFTWIGFVVRDFYKSQIGPLLLRQPNLWAAFIFYVLYIAGLLIFCVLPAIDKKTWSKAAVLGCMFGLVAYATYDLTNLATLKDWTLAMTVSDIAWGCVVSMIASVCGYAGAKRL